MNFRQRVLKRSLCKINITLILGIIFASCDCLKCEVNALQRINTFEFQIINYLYKSLRVRGSYATPLCLQIPSEWAKSIAGDMDCL